jgi:DNA-binding CsgD family transcriptional regulator
MRRSLRRSAKPVETRRAPGRSNGNMPTLSPREREILTLLAEGNTQTQIAADLVLSPRTVATHIQNLLRKLGVHSRAEAVVAAYRDGLVGAVGRTTPSMRTCAQPLVPPNRSLQIHLPLTQSAENGSIQQVNLRGE